MRIPIAPEGLVIIRWAWYAFLLSCLTLNEWVIGVVALMFLFVLSFFRDPRRPVPRNPRHIVSAADGVITEINPVTVDDVDCIQIVTFLSVFNCHVNRIPYGGTILSTTHIPGQFLGAMRRHIEEKNERQVTDIQTDIGIVRVVQLTGAIARRIICHLTPEQLVNAGDRFGLIRFGSRTDVYVPRDRVTLNVHVGQRVKGGITVIAQVNEDQTTTHSSSS